MNLTRLEFAIYLVKAKIAPSLDRHFGRRFEVHMSKVTFYHILSALPTKARIVCFDSL